MQFSEKYNVVSLKNFTSFLKSYVTITNQIHQIFLNIIVFLNVVSVQGFVKKVFTW